jgi:predicted ABC-type ATPase
MATASVVFFAGGPGSGKSTVLAKYSEQKQEKQKHVVIVAPDDIKLENPTYQAELREKGAVTPATLQAVHTWSLEQARLRYQTELKSAQQDSSKVIIYDSTLSDLGRTKAMMGEARAAGLKVKIILVYCPLDICIQRVASRQRATGRGMPGYVVIGNHASALLNFKEFWTSIDSWRIYQNLDQDLSMHGKPVACSKEGKIIDMQPVSSQIPAGIYPSDFNRYYESFILMLTDFQ